MSVVLFFFPHGHTATSRASAAAEKQVSTNASSYTVLTERLKETATEPHYTIHAAHIKCKYN